MEQENMNHFQMIVIQRITDHKAKEEKRIAEDRDRIRREEADRFQREQAARELEAQRAAASPSPVPVPATATATVPATAAVNSTVQVGMTASLLPQEPAAGAAAVAAFANHAAALRIAIDEALADMTERELIDVLDAINSIRIAFGRDPARRVA